MFFRDIPGHDAVKDILIQQVSEGRIPHAQLFCGPAGVGKLAMAIAFARYLVCGGKEGGGMFDEGPATDACGHCPACVKMNGLVHPDVHFMFPVYKKESGLPPETYPKSDDFIFPWRQTVLKTPYMNVSEWMRAIGATTQQGELYVAQANEILRKLSLRSSEGGYRVVIVWQPERMNEQCANKLLKLIEEPPTETVFLLVSDDAEMVLPTIQSRCQRIVFHPLEEVTIADALQQQLGLERTPAEQVAHTAAGSWAKALETISTEDDMQENLELFMELMRLAYGRKVADLKAWSDKMHEAKRAARKQFLIYCQRMIRESFMCNFHMPEINYMNNAETQFVSRFAPFVNERNIIGLMEVMSDAQRDIEGNGSDKIIFFDLALKMIVLLKQN